MPIHSLHQRKWFHRKWLPAAAGLAASVVGGVVTALGKLADLPAWGVVLLVMGLLFGVFSSLVKFLQEYTEEQLEEPKRHHEGLLGCAYVTYHSLRDWCGIADNDRETLRMTIHAVVPGRKKKSPPELEQAIPYVGGDGGKPGRLYPLRTGIIGLAAREGAPVVSVRDSDDKNAFLRELVRIWGYTKKEAVSISPKRFAWMAVPILGQSAFPGDDNETDAIGVVFFDSNDRTFFTPTVQELIISACEGIAAYVDVAYK